MSTAKAPAAPSDRICEKKYIGFSLNQCCNIDDISNIYIPNFTGTLMIDKCLKEMVHKALHSTYSHSLPIHIARSELNTANSNSNNIVINILTIKKSNKFV